MNQFSRTAFGTSRLLDFVSEKELTNQVGYGPADWPRVALKELLDNALDACEEQGIAPELTITVDEQGIAVADNGTGIPPDTVDRMLDFSIRVSSREAYVAPDRGAQGNALKTLVAMPFVLDGEQGRVDIVGDGVVTEVLLSVDRIRQQPQVETQRSVKPGSVVRLYWPSAASSVADDEHRFLQLAEAFTFLNPHLTLTTNWFGEEQTTVATEPGWRKWTPSSPTSPHWYRPGDLERLLAAYLAHAQDAGRERTVREFVSEFKGLSSTVKQKQVLAALNLSRAPLSALTQDGDLDHNLIARLLAVMQEQSAPVKPVALGVIGRDHLAAKFDQVGVDRDSFQYARSLSHDASGLPQVTEVAFGAFLDQDRDRRLVTGANWSAAWVNPFRTLGMEGRSLDTLLANARAYRDDPVAVLVHVAHPRVQYADRGKSSVLSDG